jgi:FkbM family methyltransferase
MRSVSELELLKRLPYTCRMADCCLVDVGAHVGGFSRAFARRGWRVVAFEPEPRNYESLCTNLAPFPNATCLQKAVSDVACQQVSFYTSEKHRGIHSLKPFHPTHKPTLLVETVRLDEALATLLVERVTLLKIDIEGADFLALQGFDFDRFRPEAVICEFMDDRSRQNFGYSHHDVVTHLRPYGYVAFVSEWDAIEEYGSEGRPADHKFLQCLPYPLDHVPAWGNLIFVPSGKKADFEQVLRAYLRDVAVLDFVKSIPGARALNRILRRWRV